MTRRMFCFYLTLVSLLLGFASFLPGAGDDVAEIIVSKFTTPGKKLPAGWKVQTFDPKKVPFTSEYEQVEMDGQVVLKGTTRRGASLIYRSVAIDWRKYPYLAWRWRVDQVFEKDNERSKAGDDYPARIYIGFKYDPARVNWFKRRAFQKARNASKDGRYPPLYTLTYVWATKEPVDAAFPNPYQARAKMVVARSGKAGLKAWHPEMRNYVKDFKTIVGEDPPEVEFIAIMIDGDNTESSGVCYFTDIKFLAKMPKASGATTTSPEELPDHEEKSGGGNPSAQDREATATKETVRIRP